jgi:3-oxoadipate enol-lactonase
MPDVGGLIVDEFGRGATPVLLLHGLGGSSSTWLPQALALAADHRLIAPELPGTARTPLPRERITLAGHMAAVMALLDRLDLKHVHIAGHSMGALLALHIAAAHPERVASLVLAGGSAGPGEAQKKGLTERAAAVRRGGLASIVDTLLGVVLGPDAAGQTPTAVAFVRQSFLAQPDEGYAQTAEAIAGADWVDLSRVTCPVLALTGDADRSTPVEVMQAFTSQLPGPVTRVVLEGCGHWPMVERPRQVSYQMARHFALLRRPGDMVWQPPR